MKKIALALVAATTLLGAEAQAFTQETHRRIAIDAVNYMKANPTTTNYTKLLGGATAAGYTIDQFAAALGQGAYDVDDFMDTYICGATTGDCQTAPVWGLGAGIVKYTSYFHFMNMTRGADVHGNAHGGYNYNLLTVWGDVDNLAASWLYGDYLDDGPGGLSGWFWADSSKYNTYGLTEAHYRQGGYSTNNMYADFENMPFQPINNLGQYWFSQFLTAPTAQKLGFVLHTTDLLQPHHTWTTSALNHSGWETWVNDHYYTNALNDQAKVTTALNDFTPLAATATDIRPVLNQGAQISYSQGGIVLNSTDDNDRNNVAQVVIPHAIAMVVRVLNRAAERFALPPSSTLSTSTSSVVKGSNIAFNYATSGAQQSSKNWIGIYSAGQTPGAVSSITWQYAATPTGTASFSTSNLSPGNYAAWYLYNDGYTALTAPVSFTVQP